MRFYLFCSDLGEQRLGAAQPIDRRGRDAPGIARALAAGIEPPQPGRLLRLIAQNAHRAGAARLRRGQHCVRVGGQGLLFSGKVLAYAGLIEGRELSWLPSYGPEMRGGTANCNVILSDAPVGSPIVNTPNVLMVMNNPSLDKYENAVQPGGKIFLDSTLIARKVTRTDVEAYYVPATKMAMDMGMPTLANMILLGALISKTGCVREESLADALHKVIPARKADLFDLNMQALQAGKEFAG